MSPHPYAATLHRDALALLNDLGAGQWTPLPQEREIAHGLALAPWDTAALHTALRSVRAATGGGRLAGILAPAAIVLEEQTEDDPALLSTLRRLIDAVAV